MPGSTSTYVAVGAPELVQMVVLELIEAMNRLDNLSRLSALLVPIVSAVQRPWHGQAVAGGVQRRSGSGGATTLGSLGRAEVASAGLARPTLVGFAFSD
jgi:hypothetical protein